VKNLLYGKNRDDQGLKDHFNPKNLMKNRIIRKLLKISVASKYFSSFKILQ
jgi:hypothetical protein